MTVNVVEDNSGKFKSDMEAAIARGMERIGLAAEAHAKEYEIAVDTGLLRNSITHSLDNDGKRVRIGTNVEYGVYIELGTSRYPGVNGGKGFLRPAATNHLAEYKSILENEIRKAAQ